MGRGRMQELGLELDTRTVGRSSGSHLQDFRTKGILYQVTSKGFTKDRRDRNMPFRDRRFRVKSGQRG
jgi:hypothetical protein